MSDWANAALKDRIANDQGIVTRRRYFSITVIVLLCSFLLPVADPSLSFVTPASAETRSLKLYFTHTRESATIAFKKNGKYLPGGLKKLNRFLRDWRRNEPTRMDPRLFDLVWEVYKRTGSRKPLHVISGYRSPKTNAALRRRGRKVASKSQHMKGRALDFFLPDVSVDKLRALGLKAHVGGVGYYRGSFIHLDTGSVRHWPRMSRSQLAKVFPRGRTLHVPSDGKPMAGYQFAMAKYKKRRRTGGPILLASAETARPKQRTSGFVKRFFGGGSDDKEDRAEIRFTAKKKPAKKETVVVAAAAPVSRKSARKGLPGVVLTSATNDEAVPEALLQPALPTRVIVPKIRPGSQPRAVSPTILASLRGDVDTNRAATIVASRFDRAETPRPVLRPTLKIKETRFALAAAPQPTPTQRVAEALARAPVKPASRPEIIAQVDDQPETGVDSISQSIALSLSAYSTSAKPVENPSLTQQALAAPQPSLKPSAPLPAPTITTAKTSPDKMEKTTLPKKATRIEGAFAALSTRDIVVASLPTSKPVVLTTNAIPKTRPYDLSGAQLNIPLPQKSARRPLDRNIKSRPRKATHFASRLKLGNLDGEDVTLWALSRSTRVGSLARLTAPHYLGILKNAPTAIVNGGFDAPVGFNTANRFSGQAIKRLAFAKFITSDAPEGQVFLTDRY